MTAVPTTDKARATRKALVRSAGAMFEESGYTAVAVRDVARENGVTTGAIYGHFRNKADLLAAVIADRIDRDLVAPARGTGAGLTDTLAAQARRYPERAGLRALLVEGAHAARIDDDAGRAIGEMLQAYLDEWREQYRGVQARGEFLRVDMDALLTLLLAMELGLGVLEATDVGLPSAPAWSATVRQILEGIEAHGHDRNERNP
ncbi:MAG: TetR family transcriptional regulator [Actinomycetota bacterium]